MHKIITIDHSIPSCHDFELGIERENLLNFKYSYKENIALKGIVFIISGFGEDTASSYLDHIREHTAASFDVVCINVFYHCFYARPNNGAKLYPDETDEIFIKKYFQYYDIPYEHDSINNALGLLDAKIQQLKEAHIVTEDAKIVIPATIFPANNEYQNFGIMQALDHLNVLSFLQKSSLNFEKNYSTTLVGSSHGGYIAHLCAKLAPNNIDLVIDNSSYLKPPYQYIVGRDYNNASPEYLGNHRNHLKIYAFIKTKWSLDKSSSGYFSNDRYRIRDITDSEHLKQLSSISNKQTKYISYHSAFDAVAPLEEKKLFYKELNSLGFDATLHIIDSEEFIDAKFIKHLNHGMDMSIKELINRELPKIYQIKPTSDKALHGITYDCDTMSYRFEFHHDIFCGQTFKVKQDLSTEDIAQEVFLQNISYFKYNQPNIYEKLVAFDSAIEHQLYKNRYELIYQNDSFDVVELSTNNHLYASSSEDYAIQVSKSINYNNDSNLFKTFKDIKISDEDLNSYQKLTIYDNNLSGCADIINYVQKNRENKKEMKNIEKFIFFGVGLGSHIVKIDKKISAKVYLIIEDDLELFRLSLFATKYYELASSSKLIFSIFDTDAEFSNKSIAFLNINFYQNHYIKYFQMLNQNEKKLHLFHLQIASQSHNLFLYSSILEQYLRPLDYLHNGFNFLNILKSYQQTSLGTKPVILLAAGPSLQNNIAWLKENHHKFIIVALSAILNILEREDIKPDFVTNLDGFPQSIVHFTKLQNISFLQNTIFLFSSRTLREIINILPRQNIFFFESGTTYKEGFGNMSAPCVGSTTYLLLIALGISELYLLGLDLAIDKTTGKSHSDGHEYMQTLDISTCHEESDTVSFRDTLVTVDGNFEDTVYTTLDFFASINSINAISSGFKKDTQNVYNLSNGAKFINTVSIKAEALPVDSFMVLNKTNIHKEMIAKLNYNSASTLSSQELVEIQKRVEYTKYIKTVITDWQNSNFIASDEFLDSFILIMHKLYSNSREGSSDLAFVYQEYFKLVSSYIFDFFNINNLDNLNFHAKNIKQMLVIHLLNIANLYIDGLQKKSK